MKDRNDASKMVDDVTDMGDEAKHRMGAFGERAKRDLGGDAMTFSEKAESRIKEAGHDLKAGLDHGKRDLRDRS